VTLSARLAGACALNAVLVVRCARCNLLRVPRPGQELALCRACTVEVEALFRDEETADGLEGHA
jgi:hypothetical protein